METGSIGARLKEARVARGLSIDDVSNTTKVPRPMLQHLEGDAFEKMPAAVFVRGFIRSYAKVVGIDPNPVVRAFEQRTSGLGNSQAGGAYGAPSHAHNSSSGSNPGEQDQRNPRARSQLSTDRKLVPLEPVSEHREGSFRRGYALLAVVAIGLLIAAWLMVGGQRPKQDTSARGPVATDGAGGLELTGPGAPALHERIDGVPPMPTSSPSEGTPGEGRRIR